MILIYTFDRKYIHVVKVSFCSQCSFVSTQYFFILQRIFQNYHNNTRLNHSFESLSRNRKETRHSALIHQKFSKNSHLGKKFFLSLKQYYNKTFQFAQMIKTVQLKERTIHPTQTQLAPTRKQ